MWLTILKQLFSIALILFFAVLARGFGGPSLSKWASYRPSIDLRDLTQNCRIPSMRHLYDLQETCQSNART